MTRYSRPTAPRSPRCSTHSARCPRRSAPTFATRPTSSRCRPRPSAATTSRPRAPSTTRQTVGRSHPRPVRALRRQSLERTTVTNNAGNVVSTDPRAMSPVYQVGSLPFANHQQLLQTIAYVPAGNSTTVQGLTAFMIATSDPDDYGQLHVYVTPRGSRSPVRCRPTPRSSRTQGGADHDSARPTRIERVTGQQLMVPLDQSVLYIRPST